MVTSFSRSPVDIETGKRHKAVFLDRDGVLIEDVGYPHLPEHLELRREILPALRFLKSRGFLLIIVTNQAGIARGRFTIGQYRNFQSLVERALEQEGAAVDATYFCPYHTDGTVAEFAMDHPDRKPAPGMIFKAVEDFDIDVESSIMIGDKPSDVIRLPGLRSYILRSPYTEGAEDIRLYDRIDDILTDAGITGYHHSRNGQG